MQFADLTAHWQPSTTMFRMSTRPQWLSCATLAYYFIASASTSPRKGFVKIEDYTVEPDSRAQCIAFEENVKEFGLTYFGMKDRRQGARIHALHYRPPLIAIQIQLAGIVHIIGPEQGFTLPGITCVCGDSHTSSEYNLGPLDSDWC